MNGTEWQPLWKTVSAAVSPEHRFGEDALLLADFACPARGEAVCDLGTGCGAVALKIAAAGTPASVRGIDVTPAAIALAQISAERLPAGVCRPVFAVADWNDPASVAPAASMDRVVCNPPYFPAGSGKPSAGEAVRLARHEQPAGPDRPDTLTAVCRAAAFLLKNGGKLDLCHRPERLPAVLAALTAAGLEPKRLSPVARTPGETPWLFLAEARKGGRPGLQWEPTIYTKSIE